MLKLPSPITDAAPALNGIIVTLANGQTFRVEGNFCQIGRATELVFEPAPKGKAIRTFGEPIPLVLTDQGELCLKLVDFPEKRLR